MFTNVTGAIMNVGALKDQDLVLDLMGNYEPDTRRWIFSHIKSLPHADFIRVLVTLRAIWHSRRKALHEQTFQSTQSTHHVIQRYIAEIEVYKPTVIGGRQAQQRPATFRWLPPPLGVARIRVHGAVSRQNSEGSVSAVC